MYYIYILPHGSITLHNPVSSASISCVFLAIVDDVRVGRAIAYIYIYYIIIYIYIYYYPV